MAFFTDTAAHQAQTGVISAITGAFARGFARIIEAQDRSTEVRRLESMSDIELSELGIARQDIVRHVFRDVYGL